MNFAPFVPVFSRSAVPKPRLRPPRSARTQTTPGDPATRRPTNDPIPSRPMPLLHMSTRLQEPSFLILTALASGPQHGYGVIKNVESISDEQVTMRVGTLYGALDRPGGAGS